MFMLVLVLPYSAIFPLVSSLWPIKSQINRQLHAGNFSTISGTIVSFFIGLKKVRKPTKVANCVGLLSYCLPESCFNL